MSIWTWISSLNARISIVAKFAFWSILLLIMVAYAVSQTAVNNQSESTPDYTHWENLYKQVAISIAATPTIKANDEDLVTGDIRQYTLQEFPFYMADGTNEQRVDRCESCHRGIEDTTMTAEAIIKFADHITVTADQVPAYLVAHPKTRELVYVIGGHPGLGDPEKGVDGVARISPDGKSVLEWSVLTSACGTPADQDDFKRYALQVSQHPFSTYGCTTCHYGSGRDLQQHKAHGDNDFWLMPLMPAKYIDAACAQCHAQHQSADGTVTYLPEMKTIAEGQKLFKENACWACHKIDGFTKGNVGPELTFEGKIATYHSIEHQLWDPRYKVNGCVMPYFFSEPDLTAEGHPNQYIDSAGQWHPFTPLKLKGDIADTLRDHEYVADAASEPEVTALTCFVLGQTGLNYSESQNDRITRIANYDTMKPPTVPLTADEGALLFQQSGCLACHYRDTVEDKAPDGHPGYAGPNLSWEGARHSPIWLQQHYVDPQAFVAKSIMPVFPFSDSQRVALSAYDATALPKGGHPVSEQQDMPLSQLSKYKVMTPQVRYMTR